MAVIPYIPQFIEKQYVPSTDVGLLTNILGQKQQQYNQAAQMQAGALSDIYGREVTSGFQPAIQESIKSFENKLQEAIDKRGGDLGAAIGDITGVIGSMYKDPKWKLATKAVEQQKLYEAARAKNPNLYGLRVPGSVAYTPGMTEEDVMFQVANPDDIQQAIKDIYGNLRTRTQYGTPIKTKDTPFGYLSRAITTGLTEREIQEMTKDPKVRQAVLNKMPQLQEYINNPETAQWFNNQFSEGLKSLLGDRKEELIKDLSLEAYNRNGVGQGAVQPLNIFNDLYETPEKIDVHTKISKRLNTPEPFLGIGKHSTLGYIGIEVPTNTKPSVDEFLTNFVEDKIIKGTPELQNLQTNLLLPEDYTKLEKITEFKSYIPEVKNNIKSWIKEAQKIVEGKNPLGNNVEDTLYNIVQDYVLNKEGKSSESRRKADNLAEQISSIYSQNNRKFKNILQSKVSDYYKDSSNPTGDMLLNFTTIDPFSDQGNEILTRLDNLTNPSSRTRILTPDNFEFITGDFKGEDKEDVKKAYNKKDAVINYPRIIGSGGNEDVGSIFAVQTPDNGIALAKLNIAPQYEDKILGVLGRTDLSYDRSIFENLEKFKIDAPLPGLNKPNIKYTYIPEKGHSMYITKGNEKILLDYNDIKNANIEFQKQGLSPIMLPDNISGSDPVYFKNRKTLIEVANILKNQL